MSRGRSKAARFYTPLFLNNLDYLGENGGSDEGHDEGDGEYEQSHETSGRHEEHAGV